MRAVLLGAPGSGKGTQASRIVEMFRIPHLSTGEMLRAEVRARTEIGLETERFMANGELVPDQLILTIVEERISQPDCGDGFVLDGFPRTLSQASVLDNYLEKRNLCLDVVVELKVDEEVLLERVLSRARQAKELGQAVRADDNHDALKIRLDAYYQVTAPLIEYYRTKNVLKSVDGLRSADAVTEEIFRILATSANSTSAIRKSLS